MTSIPARRRAPLLAVLAAALTLALSGVAQAVQAPLRVETRNLYVGSSLDPALGATSAAAFFAGVNQIWANVKTTDFPARAEVLADEVAREQPDVLALQEAARWTAGGFPPGASTTEPSFDFLALLQSALAVRGLDYTVKATSNNMSVTVPLPGPPPATRFLLNLADRDVILVRNRPGLTVSDTGTASFSAQFVQTTPVGSVNLKRGWASIGGVVDGRPFRLLNTHLEAPGFRVGADEAQELQAQELLAPGGPLAAGGAVIAAGDFNSGPADVDSAPGGPDAPYAQLTATFDDAWIKGNRQAPGFTCCQAADLLNTHSALHQRIDLVLIRGGQPNPAPTAKVIGDQHADKTPAGLWPSDHAGVSATVYP